MKNSGSGFVKEVATREFMEEVTHLIKVPVSTVKKKEGGLLVVMVFY
jgi:growth factor-regulated tyrosine kinase substrate